MTFSSPVIAVNISGPSGTQVVGVAGCVTGLHWAPQQLNNQLQGGVWSTNTKSHQLGVYQGFAWKCKTEKLRPRSVALTFSLIFTGISILSPALGGGICLQSSWFLLQLSLRKKPNVWCEVWRFFINVLSVYISPALLVLNVIITRLHHNLSANFIKLQSYKVSKKINKRKRFYGSTRTGFQKRNNWLYFY